VCVHALGKCQSTCTCELAISMHVHTWYFCVVACLPASLLPVSKDTKQGSSSSDSNRPRAGSKSKLGESSFTSCTICTFGLWSVADAMYDVHVCVYNVHVCACVVTFLHICEVVRHIWASQFVE